MENNLSIIMSGRNDNFGGDFLGRMRTSLHVLDELCAEQSFHPEVIVVDWNPPEDRAGLHQALDAPKAIDLRVITVQPSTHATMEGAETMPMMEYRAKNVGIRRCRGELILCTNPDIIFSGAMVSRLTDNKWDPSKYYRARRANLVQVRFSPTEPLDDILKRCQISVSTVSPETDAAGDFMLMSRDRWLQLAGYPEILSYSSIDSYMVDLARRAGMTQHNFSEPIYHQWHDSSAETKDRPQYYGWNGSLNIEWGLSHLELVGYKVGEDDSYLIPAPEPLPVPGNTTTSEGNTTFVPPEPEAAVEAPRPPTVPGAPICPNCKSGAVGYAGGMRNCNSCGYRF